jgi:hypothetical protein
MGFAIPIAALWNARDPSADRFMITTYAQINQQRLATNSENRTSPSKFQVPLRHRPY